MQLPPEFQHPRNRNLFFLADQLMCRIRLSFNLQPFGITMANCALAIHHSSAHTCVCIFDLQLLSLPKIAEVYATFLVFELNRSATVVANPSSVILLLWLIELPRTNSKSHPGCALVIPTVTHMPLDILYSLHYHLGFGINRELLSASAAPHGWCRECRIRRWQAQLPDSHAPEISRLQHSDP